MATRSGNIVWITSYPKSGNTWFRIFIQNLLTESVSPVDINNITHSPIATNRNLFDDLLGISSSDLTFDEIDELRPFAYEQYASENRNLNFLKVHDIWSTNTQDIPIFPAHITKVVLYIIRNPLDVTVSLANHNNIDLGEAVKLINDSTKSYCANTSKLDIQLRHKISNWSEHVNSWTEKSGLPVNIIRYEDMHENPFCTFKNVIEKLGLEYTDNQIETAIHHSTFEILQSQEKSIGFKERPQNTSSFFKTGKINSWKEHLTQQMVNDITIQHQKTMYKFGYLTEFK